MICESENAFLYKAKQGMLHNLF